MKEVHVCHIAMGDGWAGAEVQLATLATELVKIAHLRLSVILFNEGRLASELRKLGIPVVIIPESAQSPREVLRNVIAYCRIHKFDIIHTHKYKDSLIGIWAAARCGISKVVRTIHGLTEPFEGLSALRMHLYEMCDRFATGFRADRVIAVSTQIEKVLQARFGCDRVVQIYNGINLDALDGERMSQADVRAKLGLKPSDHVIGTIGRLVAVKGQDQLLIAAQHLAHIYRDLHVVVVGEGPLMDRLLAQAKDLGIGDRLHLLGHRDDTYDLMRALDVFVLPSLHEGIPMVILEALALQRPIVASQVGGIPEVITDGVHGLLVPVGDSGSIAQACERLLTDRLLAESCGRAGRRRVEQHFSSRSMAEQVAELYQSLTGAPPTGSIS